MTTLAPDGGQPVVDLDCGTPTVQLRLHGDALAILCLNRPDAMNAMNAELLTGVAAALDQIERLDQLAVVCVTGAGRAFCAGGDLKDRPGREVETAAQDYVRLRRTDRLAERLAALRPVLVAAVNGACAGGAVAWAGACDLRVASSAAVFNTAYLDLGLPGDLGGPWFLSRVMAPGHVRDWYLRPRRIPAAEAHHAGFVTAVFADETFEHEVATLLGRLASAPAHTLRWMKKNFEDATTLPLSTYLDLEARRHVQARFENNARRAAAPDGKGDAR